MLTEIDRGGLSLEPPVLQGSLTERALRLFRYQETVLSIENLIKLTRIGLEPILQSAPLAGFLFEKATDRQLIYPVLRLNNKLCCILGQGDGQLVASKIKEQPRSVIRLNKSVWVNRDNGFLNFQDDEYESRQTGLLLINPRANFPDCWFKDQALDDSLEALTLFKTSLRAGLLPE